MSFRGRTVELDFNGIKLCGRQEELSQLKNAFQHATSNTSLGEHEVATEGRQIVLTEGAPGSGRSALVAAFRKIVVDQNHTWGSLRRTGQSLSLSQLLQNASVTSLILYTGNFLLGWTKWVTKCLPRLE
jgi:hypothetical protein